MKLISELLSNTKLSSSFKSNSLGPVSQSEEKIKVLLRADSTNTNPGSSQSELNTKQ